MNHNFRHYQMLFGRVSKEILDMPFALKFGGYNSDGTAMLVYVGVHAHYPDMHHVRTALGSTSTIQQPVDVWYYDLAVVTTLWNMWAEYNSDCDIPLIDKGFKIITY